MFFLCKGYGSTDHNIYYIVDRNRAVRLRRAIARARPRTRLNCWRRAIYRSPEIQVYKIKFYSCIAAFGLIYAKFATNKIFKEIFKFQFREPWRTNFSHLLLIMMVLTYNASRVFEMYCELTLD